MLQRVVPLALIATGVLALGTEARALTTFSFECISISANCAEGEAHIVMDVMDLAPGNVGFTFRNLDVGPSSTQPTLARIYFDDGALSGFVSVINGPGVNFTPDMFPGPGDLPDGNLATPPFIATQGFLSGATAPPPSDGVEPGEFVTLVFDGGLSEALIVSQLAAGVLRAGIHVISFSDGGSASFVSVPEPSSAALLAAAALGLCALRRRRSA